MKTSHQSPPTLLKSATGDPGRSDVSCNILYSKVRLNWSGSALHSGSGQPSANENAPADPDATQDPHSGGEKERRGL